MTLMTWCSTCRSADMNAIKTFRQSLIQLGSATEPSRIQVTTRISSPTNDCHVIHSGVPRMIGLLVLPVPSTCMLAQALMDGPSTVEARYSILPMCKIPRNTRIPIDRLSDLPIRINLRAEGGLFTAFVGPDQRSEKQHCSSEHSMANHGKSWQIFRYWVFSLDRIPDLLVA